MLIRFITHSTTVPLNQIFCAIVLVSKTILHIKFCVRVLNACDGDNQGIPCFRKCFLVPKFQPNTAQNLAHIMYSHNFTILCMNSEIHLGVVVKLHFTYAFFSS